MNQYINIHAVRGHSITHQLWLLWIMGHFWFLEFHFVSLYPVQFIHVVVRYKWVKVVEHISNFLNVVTLSELEISHVCGFHDCQINLSVFTSHISMWRWTTLTSSRWYSLIWLIIFPSAYQNPEYLPFLSGDSNYVSSITQSGMGLQFWCTSSVPWPFSSYLVYDEKNFVWICHRGLGLIDLNTNQEAIISIYKANVLFTNDACHLVAKLIEFFCCCELITNLFMII